jgi:hypothetical protein
MIDEHKVGPDTGTAFTGMVMSAANAALAPLRMSTAADAAVVVPSPFMISPRQHTQTGRYVFMKKRYLRYASVMSTG